ncbi:hypothetical protein ACFT4A_13325 [Streptomyces sp. NPDC057099]|uniref:hypothetical protein n=1 Tax=Streptomyces sp. NPDC057099 TaxID=3346019 RepID=UPI00362EA4AA
MGATGVRRGAASGVEPHSAEPRGGGVEQAVAGFERGLYRLLGRRLGNSRLVSGA